MSEKKNGKGRPTTFTQKIVDTICERISNGESLVRICSEKNMPERKTIYNWLNNHEDFLRSYAHARDSQADFYADEIIEIADQTVLDPNDRRIKIDARKWKASKMAPKKYGDKITQEHTGPEGGAIPIQTVFVPVGKDYEPPDTD